MKIALISDIHEDAVSLELALQKIDKLHCDKIVCLGDISGYSAEHHNFYNHRNAHLCLELVRKSCDIIILGNHDINAIQRIPENIDGFNYPVNWYELNYNEKKKICKNKLWLYEENELNPLYPDDDISFLSTLKEYEVIQLNGKNIIFSHYAFPNLTGSMRDFYFTKDEYLQHFQFMQNNNAIISFVGHFHHSGLFIVNNNKVIEKSYGKQKLPEMPVCINVPPIVRSKKRNGFLIFDIETFTTEAIKI